MSCRNTMFKTKLMKIVFNHLFYKLFFLIDTLLTVQCDSALRCPYEMHLC